MTLKTTNSLLKEKIKTPEFYLLPKMHKANTPRRSVICSINCHTSRISELVDYYLQPEVKKLKSYVKHNTDFIRKTEAKDHVHDDSYLISLDAHSLYINTLHKEGIEAVKQELKKSKPSISMKVISNFSKLILTLNNFLHSVPYIISRKKVALWALNVGLDIQIFSAFFYAFYR